jgi:hypothetical protein
MDMFAIKKGPSGRLFMCLSGPIAPELGRYISNSLKVRYIDTADTRKAAEYHHRHSPGSYLLEYEYLIRD